MATETIETRTAMTEERELRLWYQEWARGGQPYAVWAFREDGNVDLAGTHGTRGTALGAARRLVEEGVATKARVEFAGEAIATVRLAAK
jgi:hypothetical protein